MKEWKTGRKHLFSGTNAGWLLLVSILIEIINTLKNMCTGNTEHSKTLKKHRLMFCENTLFGLCGFSNCNLVSCDPFKDIGSTFPMLPLNSISCAFHKLVPIQHKQAPESARLMVFYCRRKYPFMLMASRSWKVNTHGGKWLVAILQTLWMQGGLG